jgi:hypothetical protein
MVMSRTSYLLMGLLCLAPVAAFAAIYLLGFPVSPVVLLALALACPIAHLLVLGLVRHKDEAGGWIKGTSASRK